MSAPSAKLRRSIQAAILVASLLVAVAPAGATDARPVEYARQLLVSEPPASAAHAAVRFADAMCSSDPQGDTVYTDRDGNDVIESYPPGDLREFCVDYGQGLTLRLRTQQPQDPASGNGWAGETAALWFLDTDDGEYDHVVEYSMVGGDPAVEVFALLPNGTEEFRCGGTPAFAEDFVIAGNIPADCFGAPDQVDVAAIMIAEADAGTASSRVYFDLSEEFVSVGGTGRPTRRQLDRLAGGDRIGTAVAISRRAFPDSSEASAAYLARADRFPDALAAGSLSDGPVLLVPACGSLPPAVEAELERLDPRSVLALGGEAAVCDELLAEAAAVGGVERDQGRLAKPAPANTRYGTAVAISERAYPNGAERVFLATGERFPDALAAGALTGGPVLLVPSCGALPNIVAEEIERLAPGRVLALGGESAVCQPMLADAADGLPTQRLAGSDRFATAAAIARFAFTEGADEVFLARADAFPDALAAGTLDVGPLLLVPRCGDLPPVTAHALRDLAATAVTALGGGAAVCQQMLRHAANA